MMEREREREEERWKRMNEENEKKLFSRSINWFSFVYVYEQSLYLDAFLRAKQYVRRRRRRRRRRQHRFAANFVYIFYMRRNKFHSVSLSVFVSLTRSFDVRMSNWIATGNRSPHLHHQICVFFRFTFVAINSWRVERRRIKKHQQCVLVLLETWLVLRAPTEYFKYLWFFTFSTDKTENNQRNKMCSVFVMFLRLLGIIFFLFSIHLGATEKC